jgi:hypothetical protein
VEDLEIGIWSSYIGHGSLVVYKSVSKWTPYGCMDLFLKTSTTCHMLLSERQRTRSHGGRLALFLIELQNNWTIIHGLDPSAI